MIKIIKEYKGKHGAIIVEEYQESGNTQYHVKYENNTLFNTWHKNKRDAIARAQFIAGKY